MRGHDTAASALRVSSPTFLTDRRKKAVASKRALKQRWKHEPGKSILQQVWNLSQELWRLKHGRSSDELFALLHGLPYREEVANGRDLRGASFGGVRHLDLRDCDFSYGDVGDFVDCELSGAKFYR